MSGLGRYWLFFVIVAVGLALSWGQVGRKTQGVLQVEPVTYLKSEVGCVANQVPCAAVSADHAIVLGPSSRGLLLKQTGFDQAEVVSVEATAFSEDDAPASSMLPVGFLLDGWSVAAPPQSATTVRIRMATPERISVAEFPLGGVQ